MWLQDGAMNNGISQVWLIVHFPLLISGAFLGLAWLLWRRHGLPALPGVISLVGSGIILLLFTLAGDHLATCGYPFWSKHFATVAISGAYSLVNVCALVLAYGLIVLAFIVASNVD